jgi:peptidoglycan hydrolase-like protein with peptidoglycan-binding domain
VFSKHISMIAISASLAITAPAQVSADAGDFVAGALVGGLVGHLATKENQRKKSAAASQQKQSTTSTTYNTIPSTQEGREIQTSLNYFGFNAGGVDGKLGKQSRNAVSSYQAYLGDPITGYLDPFEQNLLVSSYYRASAGGQAVQQQIAAQPDGTRGLLKVYRSEMAGETAPAATPAAVQTTAAVATASTLPNLVGDGAPQESLAAHCNKVSLLTNTNGGFTTQATMTDPNFALNEQFCLARTYAIAQGEERASKVAGYTSQQITEQCEAFGPVLESQVDALSYKSEPEVAQDVATFVAGTGMSRGQLQGTAEICLGVGYRTDNLQVAIASALVLYAMGDEVYGELIGHHLAQGYGVEQNTGLAQQWFDKSYAAHQAGKQAAFAPGQPERNDLVHNASMQVSGQGSALPTFKVTE